MAQTKFSVNLSAADFTLSFSYKGPSVIIPAGDQNYYQATADWAGTTPQRGINIPQVMYCENTVPTAEGYRSVAYKFFIEPAEPREQRFVRFFPIFEGTGASALLGLTADRKFYVCRASTGGEWVEVTFVSWEDVTGSPYPPIPAWDKPGQVTSTAFGNTWGTVCIQGVGVFALNDTYHRFMQLPIKGVDPTKVNGCLASSGYFILWDDRTVYWSSTEANADFTPSLITGAGSAGIDGLKGKIKLCKEINGGFIVYSDVSIVSAAYSSNGAIPWIFDVLAGGAGIRKAEAVAHDINTQIHFAWTTAGLIGVELHQAKPMFPQLTDFIASGISDDTADLTAYPTIKWLDEYKEVRTAIVSSRYLCISFGRELTALPDEYPIVEFDQAFLYDLQLRRWGKLNIDHVQIFEAPFVAKEPVFF